MRPRFSGLWRNADFLKLWAGRTISKFGSLLGALQFTAILVLNATPFQLALLTAAGVAPGLLVGLVAGAWVDRLRRRPILISADIGRAALLGSIPLAFFFDLLHMEQLYLVAFLSGTLTIFFDVAYLSYLPSLVHRHNLIEANSKLSATASAAEVCAFSLGGWLVQLSSAITATFIDALSFLFSALFVGWIRTPEPTPVPRAEDQRMRQDIAEGLRVVWRNLLLRAIAGATFALELGQGIIGALILLYGIRELGFKPGVLSTIFAVGGISSILGALIAERITRRLGVGRAAVYGFLLYGLAALFIPLARGPLILAAIPLLAQQLLGDGAYTVYDINQNSLRQAITPDWLLGRVNASIRILGLGTMLVGSLLGGLLAETIGLRLSLVVAALIILMGALWLVLSPVRQVRKFPEHTDVLP